jgi:hypothetical protein
MAIETEFRAKRAKIAIAIITVDVSTDEIYQYIGVLERLVPKGESTALI